MMTAVPIQRLFVYRHLIATAFVFGLMLTGCATNSSNQARRCVPYAGGVSESAPCWLNREPSQGLIVGGNKHAGPNGWLNARQALLRQAMTELAIARFGEEVNAHTQVLMTDSTKTTTSAHGRSETYHGDAKSIILAEIHTASGAIVKAKIKDYYYYPATEKVWLWVIPTQ